MQDVEVVSTGPSSSDLRPVRGSLTDYLIIPREGIKENFEHNRVDCSYLDNRYFSDGTPKVFGVHTNMNFSGMLGWPCLFDLSFIDVHVAKFSDPEDVLTVLRSLSFELIFGGSTRFTVFSGSDMKPYLFLDFGHDEKLDELPRLEKFKEAREYFKEQLKEHVDRDGFWRWFRIDVRSSTKKPRRIDSVEAFRLAVTQAPLVKPLSGEVHLKTLLTGVHYKQ